MDTYVTISDAARMTSASRTRLYRAIDGGRIERHADGKVAIQSLLAAGFDIKHPHQATTTPGDNLSYLLTHYTDLTRQLNESLEEQIDALRQQLCFLQEQLRLSQQRELQLLQCLQQAQMQTVVPSDGPSDAAPSKNVSREVVQVVSLADEQAAPAPMPADAIPPGKHDTGQPAQPRAMPAGGLFGRWKS